MHFLKKNSVELKSSSIWSCKLACALDLWLCGNSCYSFIARQLCSSYLPLITFYFSSVSHKNMNWCVVSFKIFFHSIFGLIAQHLSSIFFFISHKILFPDWRLFSHAWVLKTAQGNDNFMTFIGDLEFCFGFVTEGFGPICLVEFSTWRLLPRSWVGVFTESTLQHVSKKVWPLVASSFPFLFLWG